MTGSAITSGVIVNCVKAVEHLFGGMVEQLRGDWTSTEDGKKDVAKQSFEEFLEEKHPQVQKGQTVGLLRIGALPEEIDIQRLAAFTRAYLCVGLEDLGRIETSEVPQKASRAFKGFVPQMHEETILSEVLDRRSVDFKGYGLIALTAEDLFYERTDPVDYVYGSSRQPGSPERLAIVSVRRIWRPNAVGLRLCALRLFKLVTHEIGHMLHLPHCLKHACNMNGVETVDQIDRHPLELCPECMAKVCWIVQVHPQERYRNLIETCGKLELSEVTLYQRCLEALAHHAPAEQ